LSHASEHKDRFVLDFAANRRAKGIDVWLDKWEMLPGDSLVDKIFEEGIKNAHAVIVVLSRNSVPKRWVREELNAGMVKRINEKSKLIPVVIDDCEIPECLKSPVWERIGDLKAYDESLDRIVMSVFGGSKKPPIGASPKFTSFDEVNVSGLSSADSLVLKGVYETFLAKDEIIYEWLGTF
jgi:hypothetical protein